MQQFCDSYNYDNNVRALGNLHFLIDNIVTVILCMHASPKQNCVLTPVIGVGFPEQAVEYLPFRIAEEGRPTKLSCLSSFITV